MEKFEVFVPFFDYEEIPQLTKEYILTVADVNQIEQIPLEEINDFLAGLYQFKGMTIEQADMYEDGWVM